MFSDVHVRRTRSRPHSSRTATCFHVRFMSQSWTRFEVVTQLALQDSSGRSPLEMKPYFSSL